MRTAIVAAWLAILGGGLPAQVELPNLPSNARGTMVRCAPGTARPASGPVEACQLSVKQTLRAGPVGDRPRSISVDCAGGGWVFFDATGSLVRCELATKQTFGRVGGRFADCVAGSGDALHVIGPGQGYYATFSPAGVLTGCHIGPMTGLTTAAGVVVNCLSPEPAYFSATTGMLEGCTLLAKQSLVDVDGRTVSFEAGTPVRFDEASGRVVGGVLATTVTHLNGRGQSVPCAGGASITLNPKTGLLVRCTLAVKSIYSNAAGQAVSCAGGAEIVFGPGGQVGSCSNLAVATTFTDVSGRGITCDGGQFVQFMEDRGQVMVNCPARKRQ